MQISSSPTTRSLTQKRPKPCHNCRRARLRCDRSFPFCEKCQAKGESCLGYGQLFRWAGIGAVTIHGKRAGKNFHQLCSENVVQKTDQPPARPVKDVSPSSFRFQIVPGIRPSLVDPLLQALDPEHRVYIKYYDRSVCRDLVSTDEHGRINPFRSMISLLGAFEYLREIILATSAVHKYALHRAHGQPYTQDLVVALAAKDRAYRLLRSALDNLDSANKPMVLLAVVFFINFDLIDSGRGNWMTHLEAAGKLISSITTSLGADLPPAVAQLADVVVADCITYHALGSLFTIPSRGAMLAFRSVDLPATLQRAAAFSYGCSPPLVLDALARASQLEPEDVCGAGLLLVQLRELDVKAWVRGIQGLPSRDDIELRISMAQAHRAAACLYIVLAVPGLASSADVLSPSSDSSASTFCEVSADYFLQEVLTHLASVPVEHPFSKGATWPTFMAGAQTRDQDTRRWCLRRMHSVGYSTPWVCPWGFVESAMKMLERIWQIRDEKEKDGQMQGSNWLQEIRVLPEHCLIV